MSNNMSVRPTNGGSTKWETFKTECIHAVLVAQEHLAHEINSAEELGAYSTDGEYFTLSRINLTPHRKRASEVLVKIHLSREAKKLHPPSLSAAALVYRQLKPDAADASRTAQDVQNAWAACLRYACTHGVSGYAFKIGHGLEILFTREDTGRRPEGWAGPAPVVDRSAYDAADALDGQPHWPSVKQRSDYGRVQAIWDYCFADESEIDQRVAHVWNMYAGLYGE